MGDSRFDPNAGSLTLSWGGLAALINAASDPDSLSREALSELREGGLLEGAEIHPRLRPVAETIARPLVRLRLEHSGGGPTCDGWIGEHLAVLLSRQAPIDLAASVAAVPRSLVPSFLARAGGLGPRARPKVVDPVEVDAGLVEALLAAGEGFSAEQVERLAAPDPILPAWLEVLASLSREIRARWLVGAWWNSPTEQPKARLLDILDSELGLFLVLPRGRRQGTGRRIQLRPVTPTQVWRLLCALVPPPEQVSEPLSP